MPDNQKNLSIKITNELDGHGAQEAAGELNDLSAKTRKYIEDLKKQEQEEAKSAASKGEVRRGLREIGSELPIVGELGRLAMEPLVGVFVLLASVVGSALEGIKALGDRSTPAFEGLTEAVNKQREALEQSELAAKAYDRSLDRIATTAQSVKDASMAGVEHLKTHADAQSEVAEAGHSRDAAALKSAEDLGLITHREYIARKLALDQAYAAARLAIEQKLAQQILSAKYTEAANTAIEAQNLKSGLGAKQNAERAAAGQEALATGRTATDEENLKKTNDKIQELEQERAELAYKTTGLGAFTTATPQFILKRQITQNDQEMADSQTIADQLRRKINQDREAAANATDKHAAAKEDVDADQARLREDTQRATQLNRELPADKDKFDTQRAAQNQSAAAGAQTRALAALPDLAAGANKTAGDSVKATQTNLASIDALLNKNLDLHANVAATLKAHDAAINKLIGESATTASRAQRTLSLVGQGN